MPDTELDTSSVDTTPLSIAEAANAYAGTTETEEPDEGQPEVQDDPEGDDQAEDDLASDEDGESEVEGEDDPEGQVETEDETEAESDQGRFVSGNAKYTLPDGRVVTISQLASEHLMDRDYRQKTMETADLKRAIETQSLTVKQREEKVAEQAEYVSSLLQSIIPPAPDPAMADPNSLKFDLVAYNYQRATREQWLEHVNYLNGEQQKRKSAEAEDTVKGKKDKADAEWLKAVEKLPEFKDEIRVKAFVEQGFKFAEAHGYTRQEFAEEIAMDHRKVIIAKKAMAWDRLQANKAKATPKLEGKPPVVKGGQRLDPTRSKARASNAAMDRLNTTGKLADGVAALLALEGKG